MTNSPHSRSIQTLSVVDAAIQFNRYFSLSACAFSNPTIITSSELLSSITRGRASRQIGGATVGGQVSVVSPGDGDTTVHLDNHGKAGGFSLLIY